MQNRVGKRKMYKDEKIHFKKGSDHRPSKQGVLIFFQIQRLKFSLTD